MVDNRGKFDAHVFREADELSDRVLGVSCSTVQVGTLRRVATTNESDILLQCTGRTPYNVPSSCRRDIGYGGVRAPLSTIQAVKLTLRAGLHTIFKVPDAEPFVAGKSAQIEPLVQSQIWRNIPYWHTPEKQGFDQSLSAKAGVARSEIKTKEIDNILSKELNESKDRPGSKKKRTKRERKNETGKK